MGTLYLGLLIFVGLIILSICGLRIVRSKVDVQFLKHQHDVAGFIIAVIAVLYGVLLAFAVILVWEQYESAKNAVSSEANELGDLFQVLKGFPTSEGARVQLRNYAVSVATEEWISMSNGKPNPATQRALDDIWTYVRSLPVQNQRDAALFAQAIHQLSRITDFRRERIHAAQNTVPTIVWVVLWIGAAVTVAFTYLFGVESFPSHALMTSAISGLIALTLFLILVLDNPFHGEFRVKPQAFEFIIQRLTP